ncbi:hypothetical protein P691DRAFT_793161 [Macrolepiota fuliginosa MF-IS2]|uniref:DDE-1 domain-containing protein n=1 Tax=Macrolepiota fuliginosa MF-IS2 TaxID=1400762 RepID=A0A9P5WZ54_9AGAR|nr:hypothetical protein P691DRAFT_793161 [Macrolepiota fuliginosa MF-IS2]
MPGCAQSSIQKGVGISEYVIAPSNKSINITIMVTICADGTAILPAVIFKGEGLGYSKKGYTDGEIGMNKIHVLCYPSHSTHLYQGLDIVIFKEQDKFERTTKQSVNKTNFLAVYAKTGIVPFNPDIIPETSLAPSLETSAAGITPLPLDPSRTMDWEEYLQ